MNSHRPNALTPAVDPELAAAQAEAELASKQKPVAVYVPPGQTPPAGFVPIKQSGLNRHARRKVQATVGRQARKQAQGRPHKLLRKTKTCDVWRIMEELHFGKEV